MIFTTIKTITGEPISILDLPDLEHVAMNELEGHTLVEGQCPPNSYYLNGEWIIKPEQPPNTIWNVNAKVWEDIRTVDDVKATKWSEMKQAREAAFSAPLTTPFGVFDCTPSARQSITDAVLMLQTLASQGTPTDIEFTLANNTEITLTTEQMVQVGLLLGAKTQEAYARGRQVRQLVADALTVAEVEAITFQSRNISI